MKRRYLFVAVTVLAVAMAFTGCDLFEQVEAGSTETVEPRTIKGTDSDGKKVEITFSRPAKKVLDPEGGDNYIIKHENTEVSRGTIRVSEKTITFNPTGGGSSFVGNYNGGTELTFPNDIPLADGKKITGFKPDDGGNNAAQKVADQFGDNASVDGNNVVIDFNIRVIRDINVPSDVRLVFNTRGSELFIDKNITITAGGGIEVRNSRGVKIVGDGKLVVGGSSIIRGQLIVGGTGKEEERPDPRRGTLELSTGGTMTIGEGGHLEINNGTLDISGTVTIGNKGRLSLLGDNAAAKVYNRYQITEAEKVSETELKELIDAVLIGSTSGRLVVENGGRFIMPDPLEFETSGVKLEIEVKAGGEVFLITGAPPPDPVVKNNYRRPYPFIGIASTEAGVSMGADYVMNPGANPDSNIKITINSKIPNLVLTGRATVLGSLDPNFANFDKMRCPVWLTYRFTVNENSVLQVGNSEDRYSSFLVYSVDNGYGSGRLTNNGRILISKKSGMLEGPGCSIAHRNNVYKLQYGDSTNPTPIVGVKTEFSMDGKNDDDVTVWEDDGKDGWGLMPKL